MYFIYLKNAVSFLSFYRVFQDFDFTLNLIEFSFQSLNFRPMILEKPSGNGTAMLYPYERCGSNA